MAEITAAFPRAAKNYPNLIFAVVTIVSIGAIVAAGYGAQRYGLVNAWGITMAFLIVFLVALGLRVHDRPAGALIDEKNLMSLSRFQLVAWTVLIVASIIAIALARAFQGSTAFAFTIPDALWQLLGITAGGAAGKEVVNSVKKRQVVANPDVAAAQATEAINQTADGEQKTTMQEVEAYRTGTLFGNPTPRHAQLVDMFQGTEVGNAAYVDISKVQMFFFTIGALVAYGADVYHMVATTAPNAITTLPDIKGGLLAMLVVSHSTYIAGKAIDHTNVAASDTAQAKANRMKSQAVDDPAELDG
ncbi:MAG TPA: hypothetical protein VGD79_04960 [Thermoanaerobaculia bacterium]|jgi:hypothetical protein